jgi:hypothetical protein
MVLGALLLLACGEHTVTTQDRSRQTAPDPYADRPDYSGDPFEGFGEVISLEVPGVVDTVETAPADTTEAALESGPYSIQISALGDEETAQGLADAVSADLDIDVFVDHVPPYWKVRVGSFADQQSAEEHLDTVRGMGFGDAWVVRRSD